MQWPGRTNTQRIMRTPTMIGWWVTDAIIEPCSRVVMWRDRSDDERIAERAFCAVNVPMSDE